MMIGTIIIAILGICLASILLAVVVLRLNNQVYSNARKIVELRRRINLSEQAGSDFKEKKKNNDHT